MDDDDRDLTAVFGTVVREELQHVAPLTLVMSAPTVLRLVFALSMPDPFRSVEEQRAADWFIEHARAHFKDHWSVFELVINGARDQ